MDYEDSGFNVTLLCRHGGLWVAMKADDGVDLGAAARQL
jgi:hypothetical protein